MKRCSVLLKEISPAHLPIPPIRKYGQGKKVGTAGRTMPGRQFWHRINNDEYQRKSFWVSDFQHKYLVKTGSDFRGKIPESPAPGMYQKYDVFKRHLSGHMKPGRESLHLPIAALTPRVAFEHRMEAKHELRQRTSTARRQLEELRKQEYFEWYNKVQRVRGKWCREQGISSRGCYTAAVDAAEIWG